MFYFVLKIVTSTVSSYNRNLKKIEQVKERNKWGRNNGNFVYEKPPEYRTLSSYLEINANTKYTNWEVMREPYILGNKLLLLVRGIDSCVFCVVSTCIYLFCLFH